MEGRGCRVMEPLKGKTPRTPSLASVSTQRRRIAIPARAMLGPQGAHCGELVSCRSPCAANPSPDEPDASIAHVRIRGSLGGAIPQGNPAKDGFASRLLCPLTLRADGARRHSICPHNFAGARWGPRGAPIKIDWAIGIRHEVEGITSYELRVTKRDSLVAERGGGLRGRRTSRP